MSTADVIRDSRARVAVLYQYAEAHDVFSEMEQRMMHRACVLEAAAIHEFAVRVLRAYRAELDDPEPKEPRA